MVDLHCHVLWGLDDGPDILERSLQMIDVAVAAGTTDLVATPHASPEFPFDPALVAARLNELRAAAGGAIRLHSGCDFHLSHDNVNDALANPARFTINGGRYLLVELSDLVIFRNTGEQFTRLRSVGMLPILTHPERNPLLRQRFDQLRTWVEEGLYLQVTGDSLLGRWGTKARAFAVQLINAGLVHFIASDGHSPNSRPPVIKPAHDWLVKNYNSRLAARLCVVNPTAVLAGEPLPAGIGEKPERSSWRRFLPW